MELRLILAILWRRKLILSLVFLIVMTTIGGLTLLVQPRYDVTAKILLRNSKASSYLTSLGASATSTSFSDTQRADYLALATLDSLLIKVIDELGLTRQRRIIQLVNILPFVEFESSRKKLTPEELNGESMLAFFFPRPAVKIEQYGETDMFNITAVSTDVKEAVQIANSLARFFIDDELYREKRDYENAQRFTDQSIEKARENFTSAALAVKEFEESEKIIDFDIEKSNLLSRLKSLLDSRETADISLTLARAEQKKVESQLRGLTKFQKISEQMMPNSIVDELKSKLNELYLDIATTSVRYKENNNKVVEIKKAIGEIKTLLKQEKLRVLNTETIGVDPVYGDLIQKAADYYAEIAGLQSKRAAYDKLIGTAEKEITLYPDKVYRYKQLEMEMSVTKELYNSLIEVQYQIGLAKSINNSVISLVDHAKIPENLNKHKSPSVLINFIVAFLLASFFSVCAALFAEYVAEPLGVESSARQSGTKKY